MAQSFCDQTSTSVTVRSVGPLESRAQALDLQVNLAPSGGFQKKIWSTALFRSISRPISPVLDIVSKHIATENFSESAPK